MDAAFKTGRYPSYTTAELEAFVADGNTSAGMVAEIARRAAVASGDVSQMTPGERLRAVRTASAKTTSAGVAP